MTASPPRVGKTFSAPLRLGVLAVFLALSACNTVDGIGRDLSGSAMTVRGWFGR